MIKSCISMKRDMDLIRQLLLTIEADEHGFATRDIEIPSYTQEQIDYHAVLLGEAGLAEVTDVTTMGSKSPKAILLRLTWAGHEFLDSSRENHIWNQAKDKVGKIGGASLPIWGAVLTEIIKNRLGL